MKRQTPVCLLIVASFSLAGCAPDITVRNMSPIEFLAVQISDSCWIVIPPNRSYTFNGAPSRDPALLVAFTRFDEEYLYDSIARAGCLLELDLRSLARDEIKYFRFDSSTGGFGILNPDPDKTILAEPIESVERSEHGDALALSVDGARGIKNISFRLE